MEQVELARDLARTGQVKQALAALEEQAEKGSAACWIEIASWHLAGKLVPRDLARTREAFGRAASLGDPQARYIFLSLLANGTGGPADWPRSLSLLTELAAEDASAATELEIIGKMDLDAHGDPRAGYSFEQLSESPDVRLFRGIVNQDEAAFLIAKAVPRLKPSTVVDSATGQVVANPVRTSDAMGFPWVQESPFVHAMNRRLARASGTSVECGEPLQVLRYAPGQEYKPHHDGLQGEQNQRILTMLIYLNEGYGGGETLFVRSGLKVKGATGDGLLFRNATPEGRPDPASLHAGLPVTSGEKLLASRWIRQKPFGPRS